MENRIDTSHAGRALDAATGARAGEALRAARAGKAEEAGEGFERLLATMLVREMRRALPEGFFGGGAGADTFEGWLDEHLGDAIAGGADLGVAEAVRESLLRASAEPSEGDER